MAERIDSTDKLSKKDRETLERKVDINVQRQVTKLSTLIPREVAHKEAKTAPDRTKELINQYDDFINEVNKILDEIQKRCKALIYRVDPTREYDCSAAIEALFEGEKDTISYDDYRKILELEATLSRELVAEGGQLDVIGLS
jgi:hypothetical protein